MTRAAVKRALTETFYDIVNHHTFQDAAALSYYFVLAMFPALILLSAIMSSFPLNLFGHVLGLMSRLLPADTMRLIRSVLLSVLASPRSTWISVGTVGLLWVSSTAFDALIEALDIAYNVEDPRPFWKTRLLAIGLGLVTGAFLMVALTVMILGPRFADWLGRLISLPHSLVLLWPAAHWVVAVGATILAVEAIYFLAPNVKQRFVATLPGAVLTVIAWLALSFLLGVYFRNFAHYDLIYGTLGGFIVFMIWFYWASFALLVGAELNAELARESLKGALPPKIPALARPRDHLRRAA